MNTIEKFKKALKMIVKSEEMDRCIENTSFGEKKNLIKLKELFGRCEDIEKVPIWALLYEIKSPMLFKDIITYMINLDEEENNNA